MNYNFQLKMFFFAFFLLNFPSILSLEPANSMIKLQLPFYVASFNKETLKDIHLPILVRDPGILKLVLEQGKGININQYYSIRCNEKYTALYHAISMNNLEATKILLEAGASPELGYVFANDKSTHTKSCIELAYQEKNKEMIKLLAKYDANFESIIKVADADRCTLPQISCLFSDDCKKKEEIYMFIKELKSKGN